MTKQATMLTTLSLVAVGLIVAFGCDRAACACSSEDAPEAVAGSACTLSPDGRQGAVHGLSAFAGRHLAALDAVVTARFDGAKATMGPFLREAIEREASCCSHLQIDLAETTTGYAVTLRADGRGLPELESVLGALRR